MIINVQNMGEFVVAEVTAGVLDALIVEAVVRELETLAKGGASLVFLDLSKIDQTKTPDLGALHAAVGELKGRFMFELVLVAEPELSAKLKAAKLDDLAQLYSQQDDEARLEATHALLKDGMEKTASALENLMVEAVRVGVQRWIGAPPEDVKPSAPEVDPIQDFVSSVAMNIDGGQFNLYLASSHPTMLAMVEKVLKTKVHAGDPLIADAACELLNYLTAYFGQRLGEQEAVVESSAPHLLEPAEIMELLDHSPKGQRVHTALGHFDVWIAETA